MPSPRPRWWITTLVVAWVAVLVAGLAWSVARGEPTAREQTTVAQALPVVDRAAVALARAATADGLAVVAISGFVRSDTCEVTVFRSGARYRRAVMAAVTPGTEQALLQRIADRLPAEYGAVVRTGALPRLTADAGYYVALAGTVVGPGVVQLVADTGACRPEGEVGPAGTRPLPTAPLGPAADLFVRLGRTPTQWTVHRVTCPSGGAISTVEGLGPPNGLPDSVEGALGGSAGAVAASPDLYGYRAGGQDILVRVDGSRLVVTATTLCR
jgi:hypothetical protein